MEWGALSAAPEEHPCPSGPLQSEMGYGGTALGLEPSLVTDARTRCTAHLFLLRVLSS